VEFKARAEQYMRVIDSAEGRDADAFLIDVARTLALLVAVAYRLPDIWDDDWTFSGETNESTEESVERQREMTDETRRRPTRTPSCSRDGSPTISSPSTATWRTVSTCLLRGHRR
jgi:hypothetical protein